MRRSLIPVVCLALALPLALTGCKAKELANKASISQDLAKRGTTDLMKEIAKDEYTEPSDGRLKEAQIQMYLKVREHEKKIAQVAKAEMKQHAEKADKNKNSIAGLLQGVQAIGSAADFMTADLRAAKDLGFNTQEYIWVKGQILTVATSAMASKMTEALSANYEKAYQDAKKAYDQASDEPTKKLYATTLAGYDQMRQSAKQAVDEDPALAYNRQLYSKYESALSAWTSEVSKYEDKEGEVAKSVEQFQKSVDAAKKQ